MCIEDLLDSNDKVVIDFVEVFLDGSAIYKLDPLSIEKLLREDKKFCIVDVESCELTQDYYNTLSINLHSTKNNKKFFELLSSFKPIIFDKNIYDLSLLSWTTNMPVC